MAKYERLIQEPKEFGAKRRESSETDLESNNTSLGDVVSPETDDGFLFRLTEAATKSMMIRRDESASRQNSQATSKKNSGYDDSYQPITIPPSKVHTQQFKPSIQQLEHEQKQIQQNKRRHSSNVDASTLVEFSVQSSSINNSSNNSESQGKWDSFSNNNNNGSCFITNAQCYVGCYYILRVFSVLLAFFLCIIAINYGLGQLISLQAVDLFCTTHTQSEVFAHSRKVNSSRGVGGCWKIDDAPLDSDSLFNDSFDAYWDFELASKFLCSIFFLIALYFILIGVYFGYNTCIDIYYQFINTNDPNPRLMPNTMTLQRLHSSEIDNDNNDTDNMNRDNDNETSTNENSIENSKSMEEGDGKNTNYFSDHSTQDMEMELTTLSTSNKNRESIDTFEDGKKRQHKKSLFQRAETLWVVYEGSLYNIVYNFCGCKQCSNLCCCSLFNVCGSKINELYNKIDRMTFYLLYPDSKLKIYLHLWEDTFDTIIQTWTLFVYAGINIFAIFGEFTLAVYPWYVLLRYSIIFCLFLPNSDSVGQKLAFAVCFEQIFLFFSVFVPKTK